MSCTTPPEVNESFSRIKGLGVISMKEILESMLGSGSRAFQVGADGFCERPSIERQSC